MKAIATAAIASVPVAAMGFVLMIHTDTAMRPFVPYIVSGMSGLLFLLGGLVRR